MGGGRRLVAAVVASAAAAAGVYTALVARAVPGYSLFNDPALSVVAVLTVGWALCLVALISWAKRPADRTGMLLATLGITWFVAEWGSPGTAVVLTPVAGATFTAGLVVVAAVPAVVGHIALAYPGGRLRSWRRRAVAAAGYATLVGVLGIGGTLFFDPRAQGCDCPVNWLLATGDPHLSSVLSRAGLWLGLGWALIAAGHLTAAMVRASAAARRIVAPVLAPASLCLLVAAASFAVGARHGYLGTAGVDAQLKLAQAATLVAVAAGIGWGLLRTRRVQTTLARAVVRQTDRPGPRLRDDLATVLRDPDLALAHRLDDGRVVDSDARAVDLSSFPERVVTEIPVADSSVLIVHRGGAVDSTVLRDELASAAGLALTNDRLRASTLDQLAELRASQIRIVQAGDAERRRLERDLHDGAQQRLVGILLGLRLLRAGEGPHVDALQHAADELSRAISDLRDLSHGLFPTVLSDEGLAAALHALAETTRLTIGPLPSVRLATEIETTVYLVVARAASTDATSVDAALEAGRVTVHIATQGSFDTADLADRVAAVSGTITSGSDESGNSIVTLDLPTDTNPDQRTGAAIER